MKSLLSVKDLKTYFYLSSGIVKAVDGVSFRLDKGKTLGIVGESGSGKSVTASSIMRLVQKPIGKIVCGKIIFEDKDLLSMEMKDFLNIRGKEIGMIFQNPMTSLDPVFTIGYQIREVARCHLDISMKEANRISIEALKLVGIPEPEKRINSYPHEFSGGMRQRVIIAMSMVCRPKLIIADEPTTALDVTVQAQVLDLLKDLQAKTKMSILLITHNLGVIWDICDTVMVMYAGRTVEYTDVNNLYKHPLHPYTWGLLSSIPKLDQNEDKPLNTIEGAPPDLKLTGDFCSFCYRCSYSQKICEETQPPLLEVEPNHFTACHFQTKDKKLEREV